MDRRNLLRTAAAAPAVPLLISAPAPAQAAPAPAPAAPSPAQAAPNTKDRFAIAVLPDTQYLFDADSADPGPLRETFRYLVQERAAVFMTHLGDVTEHGTAAEIALASETFKRIDGKLPYSVLAGNHDVPSNTDDQRGTTPYLQAFGPQRFAGAPTFVGASPDGYNSAHLFTGAGRQWLVLALDWQISDAGLEWARSVLAMRPRIPAIVTTHDLAYPDYAGKAALSGRGRRVWDGLIRDHDQIFLTLNGHHWPPARTVAPSSTVWPGVSKRQYAAVQRSITAAAGRGAGRTGGSKPANRERKSIAMLNRSSGPVSSVTSDSSGVRRAGSRARNQGENVSTSIMPRARSNV